MMICHPLDAIPEGPQLDATAVRPQLDATTERPQLDATAQHHAGDVVTLTARTQDHRTADAARDAAAP